MDKKTYLKHLSNRVANPNYKAELSALDIVGLRADQILSLGRPRTIEDWLIERDGIARTSETGTEVSTLYLLNNGYFKVMEEHYKLMYDGREGDLSKIDEALNGLLGS